MAASNLLRSHYLLNVIEVEKIAKILEELDIEEDIPAPTVNFNYKQLTAPDIRIMNRIVEYMKEYDIEKISDFIDPKRISTIEVVGKNKREDIQIINAVDFTEELIEKNIIDDDELNENLQIFLSISIDHIDKLMIRKIEKCIKDFKNIKFFKYFGVKFRDEDSIISDNEEEPEAQSSGKNDSKGNTQEKTGLGEPSKRQPRHQNP